MVLTLCTTIEGPDPFNGEIVEVELGGCAGYLPVFKTIKEARKSAKNKYEIVKIEFGQKK